MRARERVSLRRARTGGGRLAELLALRSGRDLDLPSRTTTHAFSFTWCRQLLAGLEADQHRTRASSWCTTTGLASRAAHRSPAGPVLHGGDLDTSSLDSARVPLARRPLVLDRLTSRTATRPADRCRLPAAVVDPGGGSRAAPELQASKTAGILVTHLLYCPVSPSRRGGPARSPDARRASSRAVPLARPRGGARVDPYEPEHEVSGGDTVRVAGVVFEVVDVPGPFRRPTSPTTRRAPLLPATSPPSASRRPRRSRRGRRLGPPARVGCSRSSTVSGRETGRPPRATAPATLLGRELEKQPLPARAPRSPPASDGKPPGAARYA